MSDSDPSALLRAGPSTSLSRLSTAAEAGELLSDCSEVVGEMLLSKVPILR